MNVETLYLILVIIITGIGYAIYQIKTIKQDLVLIDKAFETYDKQITSNQKAIKTLTEKLGEYEKDLSNVKYSMSSQIETLIEKTGTLEERWLILADDRITSIPKNNKEWYDAKIIIQQPIQKNWKAPKNSQTKQSLVATTHESDDDDDDGDGTTNQDFSEMDNENFEAILNQKSNTNKNIYHSSKASNTPH